MALWGNAVLAMWWEVSAEDRAELEHWHAHEHFPERLGLPGFRRASRWTAVDDGDDAIRATLADREIARDRRRGARPAALGPARQGEGEGRAVREVPHASHEVKPS